MAALLNQANISNDQRVELYGDDTETDYWACLAFPERRKLEIISAVVRRRPDSDR